MKKSAAEIRADLKAHLDFLSEAGAGFVVGSPETGARSAPAAGDGAGPRPAAGMPSLAERPPQTAADKEALTDIDRRVRVCTLCDLHRFRTNAVPGEGNWEAELMFIGEGPGRDEDLQCRPFVGRAGQLLRKIIAAMSFR